MVPPPRVSAYAPLAKRAIAGEVIVALAGDVTGTTAWGGGSLHMRAVLSVVVLSTCTRLH